MKYNKNQKAIVFDGDDTLWEMQSIYEKAKHQFYEKMQTLGFQKAEVIKKLEEIDYFNVQRLGFSKKRFPLSMKQTYEYFCQVYHFPEETEQKKAFQQIGTSVFKESPRVFDSTEQVLQSLSGKYLLILATKGDKNLQKQKLQVTNLKLFFDKIYFLEEKTDQEYRMIIEENKLDPSNVWIVGNSIRSDINPALKLGIKCFWMPTPTWNYEEAPLKSGWVKCLSTIKELPNALQEAEPKHIDGNDKKR